MKLSEKHAKLWKLVAESLAWAVVAVVAMLLMQARQVDRWYLEGESAILIVPFLFGAAVAYLRRILPGRAKATPKIVEAESFVLKRDGLVLAKLEMGGGSYGPSFALYDLTGTLKAKLALDLMEASLVLCDSSGDRRILLGMSEIDTGEDSPRIELYGPDGSVKIAVGVRGDGKPHITLSDAASVDLSLGDGSSRIALADESGTERIEVTANTWASVVKICHDGNPVVLLTSRPQMIMSTAGKVTWSAP